MNEESCSCGERREEDPERSNVGERERERERERESWSAIRVISYGCLVETGTTLVSINRRPILRQRGGRRGARALARDRKKRCAEEAYK